MSYAVVTHYRHPRETWAQQHSFLTERIVPLCKTQPGFESGLWTYDAKASESHGYVAFATEADARTFEAFLRDEAARPNPLGVTQVSTALVEILAEARAT